MMPLRCLPVLAFFVVATALGQTLESLPDSPGQAVSASQASQPAAAPCAVVKKRSPRSGDVASEPGSGSSLPPCPPPSQNPYQPFVVAPVRPLDTPAKKANLALHDVIDPFNLLTIALNSAFTIGIDSHTAYGPGMAGFGRNVGYSFSQDATGEVIGTFAVCSLFHEDPRYFRMPHARPWRRVGHVLAHVVVAQSDSGHAMVNFNNLITYPASAEISNLYVPGVHGNGQSTVERIVTGLATEPIGNFIAEFLPDFARRIHVRIVIVQQILNQIASGQSL